MDDAGRPVRRPSADGRRLHRGGLRRPGHGAAHVRGAFGRRPHAAMSVPYAVEVPDQIPKERYYDPDFYALEAEQLWPRVWQMACRLEESPGGGEFLEYL